MLIHPLIQRLRSNAGIFDSLCRDVGVEQARWKPSPEEWSILEVMNHLADEEVEDFRTRVDLTLHRPGEEWPPIDPQRWAVDRRYNQRDLGESVERFLTRRSRSADWLEGLDAPDWSLASDHPRLGSLSAADLLTSWIGHDFLHVRQINRLHRQFLTVRLSSASPDYAGPW